MTEETHVCIKSEPPTESMAKPQITTRFKPREHTYYQGKEYTIVKGLVFHDPLICLRDEQGQELTVPAQTIAHTYYYSVEVWINGFHYLYNAKDIVSSHEIILWADFCNAAMAQEGFRVVNKGEYEALFDADEHRNDHIYVQYIGDYDYWQTEETGKTRRRNIRLSQDREAMTALVRKYCKEHSMPFYK